MKVKTSEQEEARKQFEAWWSDEAQNELRASCAPGWAYRIWQASRSAIEIELPPTTEVHPLGPSTAKMFCELHKNTVAECAKAIRAAGLTVKGDV